MSENELPQNPDHEDELLEEYVPEDDAVIGVYLRRSLYVIAGLALLGAVVYFIATRPEAEAPEVAIETTAPVEVARDIAPPTVVFTDVTEEAGIDFVHESGAEGEKLLPETMGSGSAFFDYDNDGDADLLLLSGTTWPHSKRSSSARSVLYRNDGSGRFEDVTDEAGLGFTSYATAAAVGDVDNDGWLDLFVAAVGENRLFKNVEGRFTEITERAGVAGDSGEWSSSSGFFDADNDGDLDLFVCNYVRWSREIDQELDYSLDGVGRAYGPPVNYQGTFPYLYENQGDGTFVDVSEESGVQVRNPATDVPVAKALALMPVDVDKDGFTDVLVANDTVRNFFFHNQGDGTFQEVGELYGLAYGRNGEATGAMGIDAGHYRNDGELGFVIGNFANEMTSLYISQGDATLFADESIGEGMGAPSRLMLSFGVFFFDYDLDGHLDVLQANGHLESEIATVDPVLTYEQPPQLFWNAGPNSRASFIEVPPAITGDLAQPLVGRGGSFADIDGDGDLDVVLTQAGRRPVLLRNDQELGHHWLRLRLVDPEGQYFAFGAQLELKAGGKVQRRQITPTRGYQSQSEIVATFGLGTDSSLEELRIVWPDGSEQVWGPEELAERAVDDLWVIEKGT